MSEWEKRRISDLGKVITGKTPLTSIVENFDGDYPFITIPDLNGRREISSSVRTLSEIGAQSLKTCLLPAGTVMVSCIATIGRCGITTKPSFTNQQLNSLICNNDVDSKFIYYCFTQLKQILEAVGGGGSVYTNISKSRFEQIELFIPPLHEQRAIAHILGTLDDKIELNRQQNETLEAMARALFKAWFVDFEPVRAKMEGRWQRGQSLPGLPAHLYDLFPGRLVESELGEIPEGWEMVSASELIEFNPTEPLRKGTPSPYLDMAALPTAGSWPDPPVLREYGSGMRFRNGDTLLARITPCLENGKTAFVQCLPAETVGWGSTEYIVMRPKSPVPRPYAYLLARYEAFRQHAIRSMTGTSGRQRAQSDSIAKFKLSAPSNQKIWQAFASLVEPSFQCIQSNAMNSESLAQLRDSLLPKLISGELRVEDVDKFIERIEFEPTTNSIRNT